MYNKQELEKKWQKKWAEDRSFNTSEKINEKNQNIMFWKCFHILVGTFIWDM